MLRSTVVLLFAFLAGPFKPAPADSDVQFALAIPEANLIIDGGMREGSITHAFVNRIEVILRPGQRRLEHGNMFVRLNGESANTIMTTRRRGDDFVCVLDLHYRLGYRLVQGRNSVEIDVTDYFGRHFVASFIVTVGRDGGLSRHINTQELVKNRSVPAPKLFLHEPSEPISATAKTALLAGDLLTPNRGVTLTVDGTAINISPMPADAATRGLVVAGENLLRFSFSHEIKIGPKASSAKLIADDQASGNRTEIEIPILDPNRVSPVQRFAVVIGVSRYQKADYSLQYAASDATSIKDFLVNEAGFPPGNVTFLIDEDATIANLRTALFSFLAATEEGDQVVLYFAGHGMRDPNNPLDYYFLPYDVEIPNLGATGLPFWQLRDLYSRTIKTSNVVTIIDACHSGAASDEFSNVHNLFHQYISKTASENGGAVFTAADIGEYAFEFPDIQGGAFTHYLIRGLRGEADGNDDGRVVASELQKYLQTSVAEKTQGKQNPQAWIGTKYHQEVLGAAAARSSAAN